MRYLNIPVVVFSLSSMCLSMDTELKSRLASCERFSQTLELEMNELSRQYSSRQDTYEEFVRGGRIRTEYSDIAPSDYERSVTSIVNQYDLMRRLKNLSESLETQKREEFNKIKEMWFEGRRAKARAEVERVFTDSKNCINKMIDTIRRELNPQIREHLKNCVQSRLETSYKGWIQTESGQQISNKFSPQYRSFLQERFRAIRGIPETDSTYTAVNTIIRSLQMLPSVYRSISEDIYTNIRTALCQHTEYPEDIINEHAEEIFNQLTSSTKTFVHVVGLKNDFFRVFFSQLGILPICKSISEIAHCDTTDQVKSILFGSETNKGWLLETLQNPQADGHTYLDSILLIEDGESFFRNIDSLPHDVVCHFIEYLKIIIDREKSFVESPFLMNSGINISKLKIIMTGDGNFLEDFLVDKPDYIEQQLFDAFDDRLSDRSTYVIANTHQVDRTILRRLLDGELRSHEDYNILDEHSKKIIFRRIQKILQGGSIRELGETALVQKNYVMSYSRTEIKPHIKQLVTEYLAKRIADFRQ